jgi:hypothetical protein
VSDTPDKLDYGVLGGEVLVEEGFVDVGHRGYCP